MGEKNGEDHGHQHNHGDAPEFTEVPVEPALRVKALESLLVEKGLVDPEALDAIIDTYEHKVGPQNGARVVARAWSDPAYKARLLSDATDPVGTQLRDVAAAVEQPPTSRNSRRRGFPSRIG